MTDMIVKIIVELLTVIGLAMKQLKEGRFSECPVTCTLPVTQCTTEKFTQKPLKESEIEAVLQRLDRLTQDEDRISVTHTLGVVTGLGGRVRAVFEGAEWLPGRVRILFSARFPPDR